MQSSVRAFSVVLSKTASCSLFDKTVPTIPNYRMNLVGRNRHILLLACISPIRSLSTNPSARMTKNSGNAEKFWDKMADKYSKQPIDDEASYQKKLQVTQQYLRPNMEVLEFGCGTGGTALIHAPHVKHILATDISSNMIEIAKNKAAAQKIDNVTFQRASLDELKIPDNSLDAVLGLSILHLLKDRQDAMRKVHKMLKPGGIFVTSTACVADMGGASIRIIKFIAPVAQFVGLMPPFFAFAKDDLKKDFSDTGFDIDYEWQPKDKDGKPNNGAAVFIVGKKRM